ncbi:MAG: uracil phosphoribosyltransferase [Eggerthellaceae bacterium]|jgi:uracil phosphoribosyltransferase
MAAIPDRLTVVDHPLIQDRLAVLRDVETPSNRFRHLVKQLTILEGAEATRDMSLSDIDVRTAVSMAHCKTLAHHKVSIIAVLRAGIGMLDGMLELLPNAHVGFLGMFRDQETHQPVEYYDKLPMDIAQHDHVYIVDPMLATGGTAVRTLSVLRERGVRHIKLVVLIAAPEGVRAVLDADPEVQIYTCALDSGLNADDYIVPGLGDAGDRIFETL